MSVRATSWAWELGRSGQVKGGELLTLLRIADHADNDGVCWPGEKSLAEYTAQGGRTVRRHLADLAEAELLHRQPVVREEGRGRSYDGIFLHLDHLANLAGSKSADQPAISDAPTGQIEQDQPAISDIAPHREPSVEPSRTTQSGGGRKRVAGRAVTDAEQSLAEAIVAAFNEAAGTGYTAAAHLTPIVGRIREHPELSADDHRLVIAAVFGVPWWDGRPGPQVIYGSGAQFERSLETSRDPAARRHLAAVKPPPDLAEYSAGRAAAETAWPAIAKRLQSAVDASTFGLWIEPLTPIGAKGTAILLAAPEGVGTWAERRYTALISEVLMEAECPWTTPVFTSLPNDTEGRRAA